MTALYSVVYRSQHIIVPMRLNRLYGLFDRLSMFGSRHQQCVWSTNYHNAFCPEYSNYPRSIGHYHTVGSFGIYARGLTNDSDTRLVSSRVEPGNCSEISNVVPNKIAGDNRHHSGSSSRTSHRHSERRHRQARTNLHQ